MTDSSANVETLKRPRPLAVLAGLLSLLAAAEPLAAQTVPAGVGNASGADADNVIELSPFVVNSSKDTGYQATSTLAGTRLNTPLKDIGASISVYTKDFLDDLGVTNSSELLIYATGMEAYGAGGNYSGALPDINEATPREDNARAEPQSRTRARGLPGPTHTRGYFATNIPNDGYNIEAVTVSRGANAALFGVGSPAGVVDTALLRPDLHRNRNKVELRYGNNDSLRSSVDFNRVLIDRKLAVRLAALRDREEYNQRPAFAEKKRIYGALTYEPYKSTSLRANFESGHTRANPPLLVLPFNNFSRPWVEAGRPGYDWSFYDDPARNPSAAAQAAGTGNFGPGFLMNLGQIADQVVMVFSNASDPTPAFAFRSTTPNTSATAADRVKNQLFNPLVNRDLGGDGIQFFSTGNIFDFAGGYWTGANVLPGQLSGLAPAGLKSQGFTDLSAFDFKNRMIDETTRQGESLHAFNVTFEQRAWKDRVGIELAYDMQRIDRRTKHSFFSSGAGASYVRIDTNATLPTGQPNPNYGRPFGLFGQSSWYVFSYANEGKRATGYLKYDFKDSNPAWGKWLGRHTLTALCERSASTALRYTYRLATDGAAASAISPVVNSGGRRARAIVYMGPSVIGNNNPLQLDPIQVPEFNAGLSVPARYFVRAANATDAGHFEDASVSLVEVNNSGSIVYDVIKSQAAVLQSYWLQSHLITTLGWRRDEDFYSNLPATFVANPADPNDPGKVHYGFDDFSFPSTPPPNGAKENRSYSAVLRWPQKLWRLPAGTDFRVFFNQSENFTPASNRINAYGENVPPPQGKTKEYGLNIWALDEKLSLRVNRFETSAVGSGSMPSFYNTAVKGAVIDTAERWAVEGNTNPHLMAMRNADIELLLSPLPANLRQLYSFVVEGTPPDLSVSSTAFLTGLTDTEDLVAKGTEFELVSNPTPNWRIMLNIAKQETVKSNSLPILKDFIARMLPVWKQLSNRPFGGYPLGWQPGDPLPPTVVTFGSYIDRSVLVPFATALATEGSASAEQRKWRANLVANYTFGRGSIFDGKLKGWGIGGAVRWQDKIGLGYPTTRNPDQSVNIDIAHPYYGPAETNVDAWVGYQRTLLKNRVNWRVKLNVRNLIAGDDLIPIGVQPWGEVSVVRLAPERRWYLTNTFSF